MKTEHMGLKARQLQTAKLRKAALPLIKLLNEDYHPHHTAIVTGTSIEVSEGVISIPKIYDFVKD